MRFKKPKNMSIQGLGDLSVCGEPVLCGLQQLEVQDVTCQDDVCKQSHYVGGMFWILKSNHYGRQKDGDVATISSSSYIVQQ